MPYPRSFWLPDEEKVGDYWRHIYNQHLTENVDPDTYLRCCEYFLNSEDSSHHIDLFTNSLPHVRLAFKIQQDFGEEIFRHLVAMRPTLEGNLRIDDEDVRLWELFWCQGEIAAHPVDWGEDCVESPSPLFHFDTILGPALEAANVLERSEAIWKLLKDAQLVSRGSSRSDHVWREVPLEKVFNSHGELLALRMLKQIVEKTWASDGRFNPWTSNEFEVLNNLFTDNYFHLKHTKSTEDEIDPSSVEVANSRLEYSPEGGFRQLLSNFAVDFIAELLYFNRYHSVKGSGMCVDCGQVYPRSFYGHRQKYCSSQCKDRSKKRRQREKSKKQEFLQKRHK